MRFKVMIERREREEKKKTVTLRLVSGPRGGLIVADRRSSS
jgi:hypothetical protein